jgi:hypothetical protein
LVKLFARKCFFFVPVLAHASQFGHADGVTDVFIAEVIVGKGMLSRLTGVFDDFLEELLVEGLDIHGIKLVAGLSLVSAIFASNLTGIV